MKKVSYKELSNMVCIDCGKPLKVNLINKAPHAQRCWKCYKRVTKKSGYSKFKVYENQT